MKMNNDSKLKPCFAYFGSVEPKSIDDLFVKTFDRPAERGENIWQITLSNGSSVVVTRKVGGVEKFKELFEPYGKTTYEKALCHFDLHQHAELLKDDSCCPELGKALEYWIEFSIDNPIAHEDLSLLRDHFIDSDDGFSYDLDDSELRVRHPCGEITWEYMYSFDM